MRLPHSITDYNLDKEQSHLFRENHKDEFGNEITHIEYEGNLLTVIETEIIDYHGFTAMKFVVFDNRVFTAPLQGYNELSGDFWGIEWGGLEIEE